MVKKGEKKKDATEKKLKLGIIIPLKNDQNVINCVGEIQRQIKNIPEVDFKICIIDSSDKEKKVEYNKYEVFKNVQIIEYHATIGDARNKGIEALYDRDCVLSIDSDCIPMKGWIERYIKELKKYDLVYGVYEAREHIISNFLVSFGFAPLGGNMGFKRLVWKEIGGFTSGIYEDLLFLRNAQRKGFKCRFYRNIRVLHLRPHSLWRTMKDDLLKGIITWVRH